jgi:hypothetical protein
MGRVEKILFAWLVAMLAGVTAVGAYVVVDHVTRCDRFHFHAAEWRDPKAHRNEMANRLVQCHRLDGLRDVDLRAQLGKPQEKFHYPSGTVGWSYPAGTHSGFMFPRSQMLQVDVAANGLVKRARVFDIGSD